MTTHRLVDDEHVVQAVDLGSGLRMLLTEAGQPTNGPSLLIEHLCKSWPDADELDGQWRGVVAPCLQPGHVVTWTTGLTVTPSILCPDCGLHGFVTDGAWRPA